MWAQRQIGSSRLSVRPASRSFGHEPCPSSQPQWTSPNAKLPALMRPRGKTAKMSTRCCASSSTWEMGKGPCFEAGLKGSAARLRRYNSPMEAAKRLDACGLPTFGRTIGFVIDSAVHCAIRLDLTGHPPKLLRAAVRVGQASFTFT